MTEYITPNDVVVSSTAFIKLGYDVGSTVEGNDYLATRRFDVDNAVRILDADPVLASRFLHLTSGSGKVYFRFEPADSGDGVRIRHTAAGDEVTGQNLFGEFLGKVRDAYRRHIADISVEEEPVRPGQVVCDFTRKGDTMSDIEYEERRGVRYIHVDTYRPAVFRFDASRNGTTGHAQRQGEDEVPFHKFVCPFGVSSPAPVIVGSAAEASALYEQALRGELDWKALFTSLRERGLMDGKIPQRQLANMISDYTAQFDWMRDEIIQNPGLRDMQIVAPSLMVPDASMGRSQYDPVFAPSPAHVLARYINNPLLFFSGGNGVVRALGIVDKNEPERFSALSEGRDSAILLAFGSDTLGGRVPGTRATSSVQKETVRTEQGGTIISSREVWKYMMKSREEQDADYAATRQRLDSILANFRDGDNVTLVTGNVSTMGVTPGPGTPQNIRRYVSEHGGSMATYDFSRRTLSVLGDGKRRDGNLLDGAQTGPKLTVVLLEHFAECLPVLTGQEKEVSFRLNEQVEDSLVTFRGLGDIDGAICFSDSLDTRKASVFSVASMCASEGMPVIHVQDNRSEEEQREALGRGALMSRMGSGVGVAPSGELFRAGLRDEWPLDDSVNHLSRVTEFFSGGTSVRNPIVNVKQNSPALVDGYPFYTVFGAYMALAAAEGGRLDAQLARRIASSEGVLSGMLDINRELFSGGVLADGAQERSLRQAVKMIAERNMDFHDLLLSLDERPVVMSVAGNDGGGLFVDGDGRGENRFGLVLADEARALRQLTDAMRLAEEQERREMLAEAEKRQKVVNGARAEAYFTPGGLPGNLKDAQGAVWLTFTHDPLQLVQEKKSFDVWDDIEGTDPLVREKVARPVIDVGGGDTVPNNYVYIFPSDLASVMGRTKVRNTPNNWNLTGVTRVDEKTGETYQAAVGIPVRYNYKGNEVVNDNNFPCSYMLDSNSSDFLSYLIRQDSLARAIALKHGLSLCTPGSDRGSSVSYSLGSVFRPKIYNAALKKSVRNPHGSPLNASIVDSYLKLLESGSKYPLNCIPLPRPKYYTSQSEEMQVIDDQSKRFVSAEGRFVSDLMLSLRIANALAVSQGVPLRIPLDKDGNIDLGPGVPAEYQLMTRKRIESFIGQVRQNRFLSEPHVLPLVDRIPLYEAAKSREQLVRAGSDLYIRPNDLVAAFGEFDFNDIAAGRTVPLHEMSFRTDDGTVFTLKDAKTTKGVSVPEIEKYLTYTKNDVCRFVVRTTDPSKTEAFFDVLKAYCERANAIKVEARLVSENELPNAGLDGFVNLLPSNSSEYAETEHDIGREMTVFNADKGTLMNTAVQDKFTWKGVEFKSVPQAFAYARSFCSNCPKEEREEYRQKVLSANNASEYDALAASLRGFVKGKWEKMRDGYVAEIREAAGKKLRLGEAVTSDRDVDGGKIEQGYDGKEVARDGFRGYAQLRYLLPDGTASGWQVIRDLDLAKDTVMSLVNRKYRSDSYYVPTRKVMEMLYRYQAVQMAGETFRNIEWCPNRRVVEDDRIQEIERTAPAPAASADEPVSGVETKPGGRVYVTYWGNHDIPEDAYLVQISTSRPKGYDVDVEFKTLYPDYPSMVGPHKAGVIDDAEYTRRYTEKVLEPNREKILSGIRTIQADAAADGQDVYLFCYCKPGDFCHRYLVANFLIENGIDCQENPADRLKYKEGHVKLLNDNVPAVESEPSLPFDSPVIGEFQGEYRFLSNFYKTPVKYEGVDYPSVENAFQAAKCKDEEERRRFETISPEDARALGRKVELRPDWEDIKDIVMKALVRDKFGRNAALADRLLSTGEAALIEGNNWGDRYWGVDLGSGEGENRLGNILMDVRSELELGRSKEVSSEIVFTQSDGGYQKRTAENAQADDVDITLSFAVDFSTYGERATARAAGDSIVQEDIPVLKGGKGIDLSRAAVDSVVGSICDRLPLEFVDGEPFGVNIAGNGLYTLAGKGVTQEQCNRFLTEVLKGLKERGLDVVSVRTGGQTGVDEAGAVAASSLGIRTTVHAPKGWTYRGADGKDVSDEASFKKRFVKELTNVQKKGTPSGIKIS